MALSKEVKCDVDKVGIPCRHFHKTWFMLRSGPLNPALAGDDGSLISIDTCEQISSFHFDGCVKRGSECSLDVS